MHTKILVIDGVDCCGKTTQVKLLAEYAPLHRLNWVILPEFSDSALGKVIRNSLSSQCFLV